MTHAINSNTNLLSTDITRTHTQMRKSPSGEKESGERHEERQRFKKKERKEKKRKFKKRNQRINLN